MKTISIFDLLPALSEADLLASKLKVRVSDAIINNRKNAGLNQKQYAELIGVSQAMISKWESGHYNFSIESLSLIATKLNLKIEINLESIKQITKSVYNEYSSFKNNLSQKSKSFLNYDNDWEASA